jgi:hypothetical protein
MMKHLLHGMKSSFCMLTGVLLLGCAEGGVRTPVSVDDTAIGTSQGLAADRCMNVGADIDVALGVWLLNGELAIGAPPAPITLAGIEGWIASVVQEQRNPGRSPTTHLRLNHVFVTEPPAMVGDLPAISLDNADSWFLTEDRAVCAAGSGPTSCRINDRMVVVDGAGIFANAAGFLQNHGTLSFVPEPGRLVSRLHGRICGDGLGS